MNTDPVIDHYQHTPHVYTSSTIYSDLGNPCLMCGWMPVHEIHHRTALS